MSIDTHPADQTIEQPVDQALVDQDDPAPAAGTQDGAEAEPIEIGDDQVDELATEGVPDPPSSHRARNYGATSLLAAVTAGFAATGLWWLAALGGGAVLGVGALLAHRTRRERSARRAASRSGGIGRTGLGGGRSWRSGGAGGKGRAGGKPGLLGRLLGRSKNGGTGGKSDRSGSRGGSRGGTSGGAGKPGLFRRLFSRGDGKGKSSKSKNGTDKGKGGKTSDNAGGKGGKSSWWRRLLGRGKGKDDATGGGSGKGKDRKKDSKGKDSEGKRDSAGKSSWWRRLLGRGKGKDGAAGGSGKDGKGKKDTTDEPRVGFWDVMRRWFGGASARTEAPETASAAGGETTAATPVNSPVLPPGRTSVRAGGAGRRSSGRDGGHVWKEPGDGRRAPRLDRHARQQLQRRVGHGLPEVLRGLPDALNNFASHYKKQFDGAADSVYVKAGTQERMHALGQAMTALSSHADEVDTMFRREHQDRLNDIDEGDHRKAAWDISRNNA